MAHAKTLYETELDGKRPTPFQRVAKRGRHENDTDDIGTVAITVILRNPKTLSHTPGNITRTIAVASTRVSEVAAHIERALFGEDAA